MTTKNKIPSGWEIAKTLIGWVAALLVFIYGLAVQHSANEESTKDIVQAVVVEMQKMRGEFNLLTYRVSALEGKPTTNNSTAYNPPTEAIIPEALRRPKLLTATQ